MTVDFDEIRQCIGEVQIRADDEVRRCQSAVEYQAKHLPREVDAMTTGAMLGQLGGSRFADDARRLDAAKAQAAAVRAVWLAIHSRFGKDEPCQS